MGLRGGGGKGAVDDNVSMLKSPRMLVWPMVTKGPLFWDKEHMMSECIFSCSAIFCNHKKTEQEKI